MMTQSLSARIAILRTLLCFQVVFLHMKLTGLTAPEIQTEYAGAYVAYKYISDFILLLNRVAVPLFFIISGYLFFFHYTNTWRCYRAKIIARSTYLLQPILICTTFYLALYYVAQQLPYTSDLFSGNNLEVASYGWRDFVGAYSGIFTRGEMFAGQFWFIRNLFVVCLFSPIIWYLLRYAASLTLVVVGILWFFQSYLEINLYWIDTLFFFITGAWLAMSRIDIENIFVRSKIKMYCAYFAILVITILSTGQWYYTYLYLSSILIGAICIFSFSTNILNNPFGKWLIKLSAGSYFCFLFHLQFLMFIKRGVHKLINISSSGEMLLLYVCIPCIIIFGCYVVFDFLKKYLPKLLSLLTGVW